jgi:ectoine hydroxylase
MNLSEDLHTDVLAEPALNAVEVNPEALDGLAARFDDAGYVVLPGALSPRRVDELRAVIEAERSNLEAHPHRSAVRDGLNIRPIVDKHPAFRDLVIAPRTFAAVARLLGHYSIQLQQSNLIEARPSNERRLTGWHSDGGIPTIAVNGVRAFCSLKVGYFLTDLTTPESGALMVVPGSHRLQGPPTFGPDGADPVGATELRVEAGDAVIFQQGVWHAAAPNRAATSRIALYYGYSYRVMRPVDYGRMPPEVLAGCTPVERQLLGETVTHQGYYVPTEADVPLRLWFVEHFGQPADRGGLERVADVALTQPVSAPS